MEKTENRKRGTEHRSMFRSDSRGFTLVEMLITIAVYGLMMITTAELLRLMYANGTMQAGELSAVDQPRAVATQFTNEVRDATIGNDGSFPINEASSTEIIFFTPYGSGSSTTVDRIRYYLSGTQLYKGVIIPTGSPLSYNVGNERVMPVISGLVVGTTSVFSYYDGTYGGTTTPLSQPVNINAITYIRISLTESLQETRGTSTSFTFSTGAAIRNLKTNLGN